LDDRVRGRPEGLIFSRFGARAWARGYSARVRSPLLRLFFFALSTFALTACGSAVDVGDEGTGDTGDEDSSVVADSARTDTGVAPDTRGDTTVPFDTLAPDTLATDTATSDASKDSLVVDTATADTAVDSDPPDTAPVDTGTFDAPSDGGILDCGAVGKAIDPPSTLDPATVGPLSVGHKTFVVPKLDALTSVNVRVTYPTNADGTPHAGKHAWVMFHHAVHGPYPGVIYDKYDGIFDKWASHGFIVFSIDGARVFFPTSAGTSLTWTQQQAVGRMMDQAITYFLDQQTKASFELGCRLDPARLAVAGHSRGGGAALTVPTARTDGATIKGYVGFQPVDPEALCGSSTCAPLPGFDIPELWLDSALDGDVSYPINALQYSRARSWATHVTILGSKHTYTLDTPYPDQGGATATITPDEHKAVCNQYGIAFLRARVRDETPAAADLARIFGAAGMHTTVSSGDVTIRWKPPATDLSYLARFDEAIPGGAGNTVPGDAITNEGGLTLASFETYAASVGGTGERTVSALIKSVQLTWTASGGAMVVPLRAGAFTGKKAITFELEYPDSVSATSGTAPLNLEIVDSDGGKATIDVDTIVGPGWKLRPRRLSIAHLDLTTGLSTVNLTKATSLRFVAKATTTGHAVIDILRIE
jgi:hypothetical protein